MFLIITNLLLVERKAQIQHPPDSQEPQLAFLAGHAPAKRLAPVARPWMPSNASFREESVRGTQPPLRGVYPARSRIAKWTKQLNTFRRNFWKFCQLLSRS
jgi:hypothetical protein